jgi:hypothetical protein
MTKTRSEFLSVNEKSALVLHGSLPKKSENVLGRDWENFSSLNGFCEEGFIRAKIQIIAPCIQKK